MFAQLTIGGKWQGPHVFVVRIRDDAGVTTQPALQTVGRANAFQQMNAARHTVIPR